jgi:hypothetical protein
METEGFLPLTQSDLTGPTARLVLQCCATVDDAVGLLVEEEWASTKGLRATGGAGWYGRYVRIHGHGCFLSFDARKWASRGRSPLWLLVYGPGFKYSELAERAIVDRFGHERCITYRDAGDGTGLWLPIELPLGQEREDVVRSVASQVTEVADALNGLATDELAAAAPPVDQLT